jgi:1-deoxy-D-xylulose-5-phosphate reductoisomerase
MRTPIANALAWPQRITSGVEPLDLLRVGQLDFEIVDENRFPCLRLAREAFKQGGTSMAILNAANEVAVESFLNHQIKFTEIAKLVEATLLHIDSNRSELLEVILEDDARARSYVKQQLVQSNPRS